MRWIIGTGKGIDVDSNQMRARRDYIHLMTGAEVSAWNFIQVNESKYLCCMSNDEIDGTFITAHIDDVYKLCFLREIYISKFVVANTCIWEIMNDKKLLSILRSFNQDIELWFAKQELSPDGNGILRKSSILYNIGSFGFQTSLSERDLYRNRSKGLMEAIRLSFVRVSPVILLGD